MQILQVYETSAGALINVEDALRRASNVICSVCHLVGASLRCYKLNCENHFHVFCAKSTKGKFMKDKVRFFFNKNMFTWNPSFLGSSLYRVMNC